MMKANSVSVLILLVNKTIEVAL